MFQRQESQCDIASEEFLLFSQKHIEEEPLVLPDALCDSQGSVLTVVSYDCTSSGSSKTTMKKLKRENARLKSRCTMLVARAKLRDEEATLQKQFETRPAHGMLVALARNVGNGSALSAACWSSLLSNRHMTRYTVCRWEHAVATSILAGMAQFHLKCEQEFAAARASSTWSVSFTAS